MWGREPQNIQDSAEKGVFLKNHSDTQKLLLLEALPRYAGGGTRWRAQELNGPDLEAPGIDPQEDSRVGLLPKVEEPSNRTRGPCGVPRETAKGLREKVGERCAPSPRTDRSPRGDGPRTRIRPSCYQHRGTRTHDRTAPGSEGTPLSGPGSGQPGWGVGGELALLHRSLRTPGCVPRTSCRRGLCPCLFNHI